MIKHSKKMNTVFFMAGLHLKGSTSVGDIGIIAVSIKYPNIPFTLIESESVKNRQEIKPIKDFPILFTINKS